MAKTRVLIPTVEEARERGVSFLVPGAFVLCDDESLPLSPGSPADAGGREWGRGRR